MLVIGLTGGFGCGKSTVCDLLNEYDDVAVFDCDVSAKKILGSTNFRPIAENIFGSECFPDGIVNPKIIAEKFFKNHGLKLRFEAAIFPLVHQDMSVAKNNAAISGARFFIIETAILFDTGLNKACDITVCIVCPDAVRRERLKANRGYSDEEITERLKHQLATNECRRHADATISTDCQMDEVEARARALYNYLEKLYKTAERDDLV